MIAEGGDGDPVNNDDAEGWIDEIPLLTAEECADLENWLRPIRLALTKVSFNLEA